MKKNKKLLLPIYIIINVITILLCSYLMVLDIFSMYNLSILYIILLIINIIILLMIFINKKKKKEKIIFKITDLFLILIVFFSLISASLAINVNSAFLGFDGRYEGFFVIMYYLTILLLSSIVDNKYKIYIVYSILFIGTIEAIYAFFQVTQLLPVVTQYQFNKPWATGFITNPNFFGTLMLLCLSYSIGLFFDNNDKKIVGIILIIIFMSGLLTSNSLSVIVGLFAALIYVIIFAFKNKKIKKLILLFIILSLVFILENSLNKGHNSIIKDITKTKRQVVEMSKGHVEDSYGSKRIFIWKRTLWIVPDYLTHGAGIDNFYYAFQKKSIMVGKSYFDKAHNEYLQILICEGIFALISYLLFFGVITIRGMISSLKNNELLFVLPIIGYLIQAFFNISVIEVAPFFYIGLGLCINREKVKKNN